MKRIDRKDGTIAISIVAVLMLFAGIAIYQGLFAGSDRSLTASVKIGTDFNLVDHNGNPITSAALKGHPSMVFFGLTNCPDVCPTTLYDIATWFDQLGQEAGALKAYFFTVDPERDTPEKMGVYIGSISDRITGITGDPAEVARVATAWNIYWQKVPIGPDDYTMDHTASVLLVDGEGRFRGSITYMEDTGSAVAKLRKLVSAKEQ
jgi:protein SCO1